MISSSSCRRVRRRGILAAAILALLVADTSGDPLAPYQALPSKLLNRHGFSWRTKETAHFLVHYEAGSFAEKELEALTRAHEDAIPRILELLGESALQEKIHIFAVEDQARMKALTGRELIGQAMADQNAICCVFSRTTRAVGAHEVMHIVSFRQWGGSKSGRVWLGEGLAVFADDHWQGHDLHALCHYLRDSGDLAPLGRLIQAMTSYTYLVSYPECGSFVKFLYERYGREKVKQLWNAPRVDKVDSIFGKDLPALEAEWLGVIDGADVASIRGYSVKPQRRLAMVLGGKTPLQRSTPLAARRRAEP